MYKSIKRIGLLTVICGLSTNVLADEYPTGTYAAFGGSTASYSESSGSLSADADNNALSLTFGANGLYKNVGLEGMLLAGVQEEKFRFGGLSGVSGNFRLDSAIGVYATLSTPKSNIGSAYIKAGATQVNLTRKVTVGSLTFSADDDGSSFAYGAGIDFTLSSDSAMRLEYMTYYDKGDIRITGLGLQYKLDL